MRLESVDGLFVELEVVSYQFGSRQSSSDGADWDANWLVIVGKVWDGDRSWEFRDPCMTTWEARELGSWLGGLGATASVATDAAERRLWMTEPDLTFESSEEAMGCASSTCSSMPRPDPLPARTTRAKVSSSGSTKDVGRRRHISRRGVARGSARLPGAVATSVAARIRQLSTNPPDSVGSERSRSVTVGVVRDSEHRTVERDSAVSRNVR
jgi:hypothetical protein